VIESSFGWFKLILKLKVMRVSSLSWMFEVEADVEVGLRFEYRKINEI
jgi:hypothetical protein